MVGCNVPRDMEKCNVGIHLKLSLLYKNDCKAVS